MQSFGLVHLFSLASPCLDSLSRVMGLKKKAVWPSCEGMACEAYHKPEGISPTGKIWKLPLLWVLSVASQTSRMPKMEIDNYSKNVMVRLKFTNLLQPFDQAQFKAFPLWTLSYTCMFLVSVTSAHASSGHYTAVLWKCMWLIWQCIFKTQTWIYPRVFLY